MNLDVLTVMGCSSSLALVLMTANAANADTLPQNTSENVASQANGGELISIVVEDNRYLDTKTDCTCTNSASFVEDDLINSVLDADQLSNNLDKTLARLKLGCDCQSCQNISSSFLRRGDSRF